METRPIVTMENFIHLSFTLTTFLYNTKICYTTTNTCKPHHLAATVSFSYNSTRQVAAFETKLRFMP